MANSTDGNRPEQPESSIVAALRRAVRGTPHELLSGLAPGAAASSDQFNARLDDGSAVVFRRRSLAVEQTEVLVTGKEGAATQLADGVYRLRDGVPFSVVAGRVNFDAVFKDPDGVEPFRQYGAWREVVAIDSPLLSLPDPLDITDLIRLPAIDGRFFFAVQYGEGAPYRAFEVKGRTLEAVADGLHTVDQGTQFTVAEGTVHADSLAGFKAAAHALSRLPE